MRELLMAAAERAIRYLEDLSERGVAPDPSVVARLAELAIQGAGRLWSQPGGARPGGQAGPYAC